ncbi:MAG: TonB-dependent receptor, partial [Burkholderiales bacterium]
LSFLSITAYRAYHTWSTWDEDASPVAVNQLDNKLDNWQFTQEMRLLGTAGNVDWTLGGFYLDQESTYNARVDLNYALIDFLHGPDPTPAHTWALFAHGNWHVTDNWNVIGGVRYSDEYKSYTHYRRNPDGSAIGSQGPTFPPIPVDFINIRLTGVNGLTAKFTDSRVDWRVATDYTFDNDVMLYSSASTGYKSGGVNPRPFFPAQLKTFTPETVISYELGVKSTLLDDALRVNAAVFYTDYSDIQLTLTQCEVPPFIDPDGIAAPCLKPANVGDAHIKGLELEAMWYPAEGLMIDASASWLDFEYTYVDPLALGGSSIAPLDMITPYTPKNKWSAGIQYTFSMTNGSGFTLRLDGSHQGDQYADATNDPINQIDGFTLFNALAWWDSPDADWRIEFQWLNFTNKLYYMDLYDVHSSQGTVLAQPGLPQTFNISFTRNF